MWLSGIILDYFYANHASVLFMEFHLIRRSRRESGLMQIIFSLHRLGQVHLTRLGISGIPTERLTLMMTCPNLKTHRKNSLVRVSVVEWIGAKGLDGADCSGVKKSKSIIRHNDSY